jgi:Domain of unknown function (DUF4123)
MSRWRDNRLPAALPPPIERGEIADGDRVALLIDGAQTDRLSVLMESLGERTDCESVFRPPLAPEAGDATPHVAGFADVGDARRCLQVIAARVRSHGAISVLVGPLTAAPLALRLRARLDAVLPDRLDCINRFFDGRVTPHLFSALQAAQRTAFFAVCRQWWLVSHDHQWQWLPVAYKEADDFEGPLHLDVRQQAQIIDGCYPYAVMEHFEQTSPDLLDDLPQARRYAFFSGALAAAARYGIDGGASAVLFCTLALTRGERFHEESPWPDALQRVRRGETTLERAVRAQHQ